MIREPVVSGQFYPDSEKDIRRFIEGAGVAETTKTGARGIILPHAGYVYSGKVAAVTVSKIMPVKKVIILGNNHSGYGEPFALWAKGSWKTPLGEVKIEETLAKEILNNGEAIREDYLAHKFEHSIEVELPILRYFLKDFEFAPIACMAAGVETYEKCAEQICKALKSFKEDILFVASTDMTHYEPDQTARKKDRLALEQIINLDAGQLIKTVKKENITMCGIAPVAILLLCMKKLGAAKANVALYQTSGDASGDYRSVVGYAGVIIQ